MKLHKCALGVKVYQLKVKTKHVKIGTTSFNTVTAPGFRIKDFLQRCGEIDPNQMKQTTLARVQNRDAKGWKVSGNFGNFPWKVSGILKGWEFSEILGMFNFD